MAETDEGPIFPIFRDRAPVLDRIRNNRDGSGEEDEAFLRGLGEKLGEGITRTESFTDEEIESIEDEIRAGLSIKLGVPEEAIDDGFIESVSSLFVESDETDVLTNSALEELGIKDDEDSDDSSDLFD